jgi:folylpolyglutamate synthase/dihydropteroate synthase
VEEAIEAAKAAANPEDVIFITGSCFVVGEVLTMMR